MTDHYASDARKRAIEEFGAIDPTLSSVIADAPDVAQAFLRAHREVTRHGSLNPMEQLLVRLAVHVHHGNDARIQQVLDTGRTLRVAQTDLDAVVAGRLPTDERYRPLVHLAWQLLGERPLRSTSLGPGKRCDVVAWLGLTSIIDYVDALYPNPNDVTEEHREL